MKYPRILKVTTIKKAYAPENESDLPSFLRMASYCARFIPEFATITEPLIELARKNIIWKWDDLQEEALLSRQIGRNRLLHKVKAADSEAVESALS